MKIYIRDDFEIRELCLSTNAKPMIEVDKDIDVNEVLRIRGELYYVCIKSKDYVVVRKLNVLALNEEPEDLFNQNEIKCPYCESEMSDSWEMPDEDGDYECPFCHSHFSYVREVSATYTSCPISKSEHIIDLN